METSYSKTQKLVLIVTQLLVGWHFLYEGFVKVLNPGWTSQGYLQNAQGFLSSIFKSLASNGMINFVDTMVIASLILVGLSLVLGIHRAASRPRLR